MAQELVQVTRRETTGKNDSRRLRAAGRIPAVVYGDGKEPIAISVLARTIDLILHSARGENTIFDLRLEGTDQKRAAMIKEFQIDPVTDALVHADFIRIAEDRELHLNVPVVLVGVAIGVTRDGGRLDWPLREVAVACLPKDIPPGLEIEVGELELHHSRHVSDLEIPEGVTLLTDADSVLCSVHAKMAEEVVEVEEVEEVAEGEVAAADDESAAPGEGDKGEEKQKKDD